MKQLLIVLSNPRDGRDAEDVRAGLPPNPALDRLLLLVFK